MARGRNLLTLSWDDVICKYKLKATAIRNHTSEFSQILFSSLSLFLISFFSFPLFLIGIYYTKQRSRSCLFLRNGVLILRRVSHLLNLSNLFRASNSRHVSHPACFPPRHPSRDNVRNTDWEKRASAARQPRIGEHFADVADERGANWCESLICKISRGRKSEYRENS